MSWADNWENTQHTAKFSEQRAKEIKAHAERIEKHRIRRDQKLQSAKDHKRNKRETKDGETPVDKRIEVMNGEPHSRNTRIACASNMIVRFAGPPEANWPDYRQEWVYDQEPPRKNRSTN